MIPSTSIAPIVKKNRLIISIVIYLFFEWELNKNKLASFLEERNSKEEASSNGLIVLVLFRRCLASGCLRRYYKTEYIGNGEESMNKNRSMIDPTNKMKPTGYPKPPTKVIIKKNCGIN